MFTNGLNIVLSLFAWVEKIDHRVETHLLSGEEKVLGTVISKEGHADSHLRHERAHHYWFKKIVHGDETHLLSGEEKVLGTVISKEGHADSHLRLEKTHHSWFPKIRCNRQ